MENIEMYNFYFSLESIKISMFTTYNIINFSLR